MPDLRPPRADAVAVVDADGLGFGVRPHRATDLDLVAGTDQTVRIRVRDGDGRPIPVRGLHGTFRILGNGTVLLEATATPDPLAADTLRVRLSAATTALLPVGEHFWTFDLLHPELGTVRLRHGTGRQPWGTARVARDPVTDPPPAAEFDAFTGESVDFDPQVVRWVTAPVAGPATLGRPTGLFTVQFVYETYSGSLGIDVSLDFSADPANLRWTTVGPRFDGEPLVLVDATGTDAWNVEADARWVRAWWQPETSVPDPGRVTRIRIMV